MESCVFVWKNLLSVRCGEKSSGVMKVVTEWILPCLPIFGAEKENDLSPFASSIETLAEF